jgi:two-component system cell cycle sensor histidine kinase/response regulator CckA
MRDSLPTVLVVDDEKTLLTLMTRLIEKAGYRVLSAASGDEARSLFAAHGNELDLVVLDVTMPGGQGAEVLMPEFLTARPELSVVVTSGDEPPEALRVELERVGGRFLKKPFASRALRALLEEVAGTGEVAGAVAPEPR